MNIQGWINNQQVRNATPRRHLVLFYGNYSLDTQSITSQLGRGRALSTQRTQTVVPDRRGALECTCPLSSYARTHNIGGLPQWITSGFFHATVGIKPRFLAWSCSLPIFLSSPSLSFSLMHSLSACFLFDSQTHQAYQGFGTFCSAWKVLLADLRGSFHFNQISVPMPPPSGSLNYTQAALALFLWPCLLFLPLWHCFIRLFDFCVSFWDHEFQ